MLAPKEMIRDESREEASSIAMSRSQLRYDIYDYIYKSFSQANCTVKDEVDAVMSAEIVLALLKLLKDYLKNLKSSTSTLQMRLVRHYFAYVL